MKKRILSVILSIAMLLTATPLMSVASESEYVYMSVSYDDKYTDDKNGNPIAYIPVSLETLQSVDLNEYNLSEYLYDEDGDGNYDITALQLIIYAHEELYGGDWSEVTFTGSPGSSYFAGGLFGRDENLNYYLNGQYPLASGGWGATSDQIVLEAGDFIDLAGFTSWDFYQDSAYGFHYFADANGDVTHSYTTETAKACDIKLIKGTKDYEYNSVFFEIPDYEVHYGKALYNETGSVATDDSGCASITFPSAGKWYLWVDGGYGNEYPDSIVSAPGYAEVTVTSADAPREPQDVSAVLNATMAQLADTVQEPAFGTDAGEWTVLSLARGEYFEKNSTYFNDYYNRIVSTVNETASSVNMNGALHTNKSTENSRLIVALSSIGKDATAVGDWNLVEAYSLNGFDWVKKQGLNGTIWALIALDSGNYETSDETIRQQCIDSILSLQHDDGGWALQANKTYASDPDVTGMALQALYPYRNQTAVAEACEKAFDCLSEIQHENGTFASGGSECSESCAWVIVACTTWGINPDTDSRFVKNRKSVVDGLLLHYLEDKAQFEHIADAGANGMATDQSCYALVAYKRFINNKTNLFDMSDVAFDENVEIVPGKMTATLGLPAEISDEVGKTFNATISIDQWDNNAGYKLIDFIMNVPEGLTVTAVTAESRLSGGTVNYNVEKSTGKLRAVYFDANNHSDITVSGTTFPALLFIITFRVDSVTAGDKLGFNISGMSVKLNSDSADENSMIIVDITDASGTVNVVTGVSYSAMCLYVGDNVDLIPSEKMAVAVAVVGAKAGAKLSYNDGINGYEFKYSTEISDKTGISTYVALVDSSIDMAKFVDKQNFVLSDDNADEITFGDANGDGVINAQDALGAVDSWLRKTDAPSDDKILALNVNSDSRINTFDALGIVEAFVDGSEYIVVTKAATITANN